MKCSNCKYNIRTSYEYGEYECALGLDETPENSNCDGCRARYQEIMKVKRMEEKINKAPYDVTSEDYNEISAYVDNLIRKYNNEENHI